MSVKFWGWGWGSANLETAWINLLKLGLLAVYTNAGGSLEAAWINILKLGLSIVGLPKAIGANVLQVGLPAV